MREIKFRAWIKTCDELVYEGWNGDRFYEKKHLFALGEDAELQQYTGLKDRNGKEIYEGDIVTGWKRGSNSDRGYTGEVKWNQQQAGFYILCGKYFLEILSLGQSGGHDESVTLDSFEVIGNIYESKELEQ